MSAEERATCSSPDEQRPRDSLPAFGPASGMAAIAVCLSCVAAALGQLTLFLFSQAPLGVEGEWVWPRLETTPQTALAALPVLTAGAIIIGYTIVGARRRVSRSCWWLLGLVMLGTIWIPLSLHASSNSGGLGRTVFVLFYPRTSGYFHQAWHEADDLSAFIRDYEASIQDQSNPDNYLHIGTHPPGLTAINRLLIEFCRGSPEFSQLLTNLQPQPVRDAIDQISWNQLQSGQPLEFSDAAALWLSILISLGCVVVTVVPLYSLATRLGSTQAARVIAVSWLFVPAVLVFFPKSDTVFALLTVSLQWLWLRALQHNSMILGAGTAVLFVACATLSLAFFPVGAVLFLQLLLCLMNRRKGIRPAMSGIVVGVGCLVVIDVMTDLNLLTTWWQNLRNHAVFYQHNSRSMVTWLWVNPIEVSLAVGAPLTVCSVMGIFWMVRRFRSEHAWALCGPIVWTLLWVSGKNMGEAARLWIFFMPYALLCATPVIDALLQSPNRFVRSLAPTLLLGMQCIVSIASVLVIDGFGLTQLQGIS